MNEQIEKLQKKIDELEERVTELGEISVFLISGLSVVVTKLKDLNKKVEGGEKNE